MRVNLLKRMESSIHSFTLTVSKLLNQVESLLSKIDDHDSDLIDALNIEELQDIELESTELEQFMIGNKTKVLLQDMDLIRFRQELEADKIFLSSIVEAAKGVTAQRDAKLELLKQTIAAKVRNPLNPDNKKVIVFTAFADTAQYLYSHIAQWASLELGIHSALITGGGTNKTTLSGLGIDLNNILTTLLTSL